MNTTQQQDGSIEEQAQRIAGGPLPIQLIERGYGTREQYIAALDLQVVEDRQSVVDAGEDAPQFWRESRLRNARVCEIRAATERRVQGVNGEAA